MPRPTRRCNFCPNNSREHQDRTFFTLNDDVKKSLMLRHVEYNFCDVHFDDDDVLRQQRGKRLRTGAMPCYFPRLNTLSSEHNYVKTVPLVLVSLFDTVFFIKDFSGTNLVSHILVVWVPYPIRTFLF